MPIIDVTDVSRARELLRAGWHTRAVGVADPDYKWVPEGVDYLLLRFDDVERLTRGVTAACRDDVRNAIAHVAGMGPEDRLLVHCLGGTSRGPAMAIGLLASLGDDPASAVARVAALRPSMSPNMRVIEIFDRVLGLDTALTEAVYAWRSGR